MSLDLTHGNLQPSRNQNLRHNFGLKQKKIMKIFLQTGENETLNSQEIILKHHSTSKKSSTIILARKHGTAPGWATPSTSTGMLTRAWSWCRPGEGAAASSSRATWWGVPGCSGSNSPQTRNTSCWHSDRRGKDLNATTFWLTDFFPSVSDFSATVSWPSTTFTTSPLGKEPSSSQIWMSWSRLWAGAGQEVLPLLPRVRPRPSFPWSWPCGGPRGPVLPMCSGPIFTTETLRRARTSWWAPPEDPGWSSMGWPTGCMRSVLRL